MKKLLAALVMAFVLLFTIPVIAQVDTTPEVLSSKCIRDGCIMEWKVTLHNMTTLPLKGNLIITVMDKNKDLISSFRMGAFVLKGSETQVLQGMILFENSDRTKSMRYMTATTEDVVQMLQVNKGPILKF